MFSSTVAIAFTILTPIHAQEPLCWMFSWTAFLKYHKQLSPHLPHQKFSVLSKAFGCPDIQFKNLLCHFSLPVALSDARDHNSPWAELWPASAVESVAWVHICLCPTLSHACRRAEEWFQINFTAAPGQPGQSGSQSEYSQLLASQSEYTWPLTGQSEHTLLPAS